MDYKGKAAGKAVRVLVAFLLIATTPLPAQAFFPGANLPLDRLFAITDIIVTFLQRWGWLERDSPGHLQRVINPRNIAGVDMETNRKYPYKRYKIGQ